MNIGIDLDKTLFDCRSLMYTFANNLTFNKKKKLKHKEISKNAVYKCTFVNKIFKFLNPNYYFTFPKSVETINQLSDQGFEVHLVSNRPNMRVVIALTLESLEKSGVKYDKLVLGCNNKLAYAKQEKLAYFIDNMEDICEDFAVDTKVKPICFKGSLKNEKRLSLLNVSKFNSWEGISTFFSLERKRIENEKNGLPDFVAKLANSTILKGGCLSAPSRENIN